MEQNSLENVTNQKEIQELTLQVQNLTRELEDHKKQTEITINKIQSEIDNVKNEAMSVKNPSRALTRMMDSILEIKRKNVEDRTNIEADKKKIVSNLYLQIAESNKRLLQYKAQNAELTIENLDYKSKINQLDIQLNRKSQDVTDSQITFQLRTKDLYKREMDFYNTCISKLDGLDIDVPAMKEKIERYKKNHTQLIEDSKHFSSDVQEYDYVIDHLIRSISFLTDVPMTKCPTSKDVVNNPEVLQKLIQHSYNASTTAKQLARSKLMASSLSLSQLLKPRASLASLPVAKVLTNLGAASFDVAEKMEERHRDTMTILDQSTTNPTKDISSMDFLSTSI